MEIPCGAIASTLSCYRTDIELSNFLGIAYSTTMGWGSRENYGSEKIFQMYLLEYFRRLNVPALEKIHYYYDLQKDNDVDFISEIFIPEKEANALLVSRVEWKRKTISMLLDINKEIFQKQVEMIKLFVTANESISEIDNLLKGTNTLNSLPSDIQRIDVSHLKAV